MDPDGLTSPPSTPTGRSTSSPKGSLMSAKHEEPSQEKDKQRSPKSHSPSASMVSRSSFSTLPSIESVPPIIKSSAQPSENASGGSWTNSVKDFRKAPPSPSPSVKSTRDLPSLQTQWQAIQLSLANQSQSFPPNAPPGNKASYPGIDPSKVPPGNKASYSGSIANMPPGNKATSFISPSSLSVSSMGSPSGSGHTFYPAGGHLVHPSSGHTLHSVPGKSLHAAGVQSFTPTYKTPMRDTSRRMSQSRERRFSTNEATILEEASDPNKDKKGGKEGKMKEPSKEQKKK